MKIQINWKVLLKSIIRIFFLLSLSKKYNFLGNLYLTKNIDMKNDELKSHHKTETIKVCPINKRSLKWLLVDRFLQEILILEIFLMTLKEKLKTI